MKQKDQNFGEKPVLSRDQVRACDRIAMERYQINGLVLMENAGGAAARQVLSLLEKRVHPRVAILAGTGNNAGDGFVVARHLNNSDIDLDILILGSRDKYKGDALSNLRIIERMNLPITTVEMEDVQARYNEIKKHLEPIDLIVDAMLGTGTSGEPREPIKTAIHVINEYVDSKTIVALDIPSGLDCDSGKPLEIAVRADHTITFAALKKGFLSPDARPYIGEITIASIGIDTRRLLNH